MRYENILQTMLTVFMILLFVCAIFTSVFEEERLKSVHPKYL